MIPRLRSLIWLFVCSVCVTGFAPLRAQDPKAQDKAPDVELTVTGIDPAVRAQLKFPEPAVIKLTTSDGLSLSATFYGGMLGKRTPALILLHDLGGSSKDLTDLAAWLQTTYGYASIVPDLRGHGESKVADDDFDPAKMSSTQFASIGYDVEACKVYLRDQQNNEGNLNIDMLTVLAVGKMNIVAVEWAFHDWSFPPLAGKKQGQDVKSLVMISPEQSYKSVKMSALKEPLFSGKNFATPLTVLIETGPNDKSLMRKAKSIESSLNRGRKNETEKSVFLAAGAEENGAALTKAPDPQKNIAEFVFYMSYKKAESYPWQVRGQK